ncbi:hypothetical protein A2U01_0041622, partial [Trifolium medium]|nr:hypothetical protein [Trifolium medium]
MYKSSNTVGLNGTKSFPVKDER